MSWCWNFQACLSFLKKWKQRFFVLHKPTGSLPDQYELSYYSSEQCSKKKGSIDLDQCEQIIESLDSDQYPYLLAIKTICRSKVRTYYLATNSEESMNTWVQCLCRVCGLKQEDTPTDIPDVRYEHGAQSNAGENASGETGSSPPSTVTSQPVQAPISRGATVPPSSSTPGSSHPAPSTSPQSYVFLNDCTTGTAEKRSDRYGRTDSVDSVPEYEAPPPPVKKGSHFHNNNNEEFSKGGSPDSGFDVYDRPPPAGQETYSRPRSGFQEVYDRPRSGEFKSSVGSQGDDDFYKVPPASSAGQTGASMDTVDLNSAVPLPVPRRSPRSARSSLSDRPDSVDSFSRPMTDCYDVPPSGHIDRPVETYDVPPPGFSDRPVAETYDVPPADMSGMETYDVPPPSSGGRPVSENYDFPPPRPAALGPEEGTSGSSSMPPRRPPKPHNLTAQSVYQNMPNKSRPQDDGGLNAVPSAPTHCTPSLSYDVPRSSSIATPPRDSNILDVAPPRPAPRSMGGAAQAYQNAPPVLPPLPEPYHASRNGDKREAGHRDRDHAPPKPADLSKTGGGRGRDSQDLYQVPPVVPRIPARSTTMPPGRGGTSTGAVSEEMEAHYIWSNTRTKSFKRNHQLNATSAVSAKPPLEPRRPPLPLRSEFASSSDDDDDVSVDGSDIQTHIDPGIIRMSTTVPVATEQEFDPELKYLDLDLDTPPDLSRPQAAGTHGKGTEYREIDFDRTQALQEARRARHLNK
ncbi:uncharacterized protein LOC143298516 isoform X2 [Babylonia areolata]|uniref:uncharacterized protein LOC143298516 isoform X2 n=1 Tax=Babylonia areolata TaxID=304850 RepID=UPI003FD4A585